jgi:hypothetical protein
MATREVAIFVRLSCLAHSRKRTTDNRLGATAINLKSGRYSVPQFAEFKYGR